MLACADRRPSLHDQPWLASLRWLAVVTAVLLGTGCAGRSAQMCDEACECEDCNEHEYEECVIERDAEFAVADAYDCSDEADSLWECAIDAGHCDPHHEHHWTWDDACHGDEDALAECIAQGSALD